jgi:hypothetical protein
VARLYLTFGSVPELRPLARLQRLRVLQASAAAYAKTPASWWDELLRVVLILGLPIASGLIAYLVFKDTLAAVLAMVVIGMTSYRIWFQFHMTQLRPFMREVLQGPIPDAPVPSPDRWRQKPWVAGLVFGALMASLVLLTENRLPLWALLPFAAGGGLVSGLLVGGALWFLRKPRKGRWGSIERIDW